MGKQFKKERHLLAYLFVRMVIGCTVLTPRFIGWPIAGFIGHCFFYLLKKERSRTLENLTRVFPEKSSKEIRALALDVYRNLGYSFFDSIKLPSLSKEKVLSYVGEFDVSPFKPALEKGKGLIILAGHLSAFELQTQFAQLLGIDCVTVGAALFDKRIDDEINKLRTRNGVSYIGRDGAMRGILKALRAGKLFGVLIDQDTTPDGVFAPFLGSLAWTPATSIKMALKGKVPMMYLSMHRKKDKKYYVRIEEPTVEMTGDLTTDLLAIAAGFNKFYERDILAHPEQWPWMHRRWKRPPERYPHHPMVKLDSEENK